MSYNLVSLYKKAWESHDLNMLNSLFHKDIRYQEHWDNVLIGIDEVKDYWQSNSEKQSNVTFSPIKMISVDENIVIHWNADFFEVVKNKKVYLKGIMWFSLRGDKIIELTEYFEEINT